jgi:hypothetical protein
MSFSFHAISQQRLPGVIFNLPSRNSDTLWQAHFLTRDITQNGHTVVALIPEGHEPIPGSFPLTRQYDTLTYCGQGDSALYRRIAAGDTIRWAYIQDLDLAKLAAGRNIPHALYFDHCILLSITYGKDSRFDSLHFEKPVVFRNCDLPDIYSVSDRFDSLFALIDCTTQQCTFHSSHFDGNFYLLSGYSESGVNLWNDAVAKLYRRFYQYPPRFEFSDGCVFHGKTYLFNNNTYLQLILTDNSFFQPVFLCPFHIWPRPILEFSSNRPDLYNSHDRLYAELFDRFLSEEFGLMVYSSSLAVNIDFSKSFLRAW